MTSTRHNIAPSPATKQLSFEDILFPTFPQVTAVPEYLLVPVYGMRLFVQDRVALKDLPHLRSPLDVAHLFWKYIPDPDREHFCVCMLDTKSHVIGMVVISVGDLSTTIVHPREVFKAALIANAASVLLVHNHPSGNLSPSTEDIAVTRRLQEAGTLLGVPVKAMSVSPSKNAAVSPNFS
jgi:DNA repair protein RadC